MKNISIAALCLSAALSLTACGTPADSTTTAATTTVPTTVGNTTATTQVTTVTTAADTAVTTMPSVTTTKKATATTTKEKKTTTAATTTVPKPAYGYVSGQTHTPLPLEQRYLYSLLDDEMKACYRKIDEAVNNLEEEVILDTNLFKSKRTSLISLYMADNPQHFYLTARCLSTAPQDGDQTTIVLSYAVGNNEGEFCSSSPLTKVDDALRAKIRAKKATFDAAVDAIVSTIPANAPDAVKERLIYDRILLDAQYNLSAPNGTALYDENFNAYGILVNHTGVCESYMKAFQVLCHAVGINATCVKGSALGGGHGWTCVKLDGEWYMCDITFDDPIGANPNIPRHDYFNLTTAQMKAVDNHTWTAMPSLDGEWKTLDWPVPDCNGTKYSWQNYGTLYGY